MQQDVIFRLSTSCCMWTCLRILYSLCWWFVCILLRQDLLFSPLEPFFPSWTHASLSLVVWLSRTFEMMRYSGPTYKNGLWLNPCFQIPKVAEGLGPLMAWILSRLRRPCWFRKNVLWDFSEGCTGSWRWRNAAEKSQDHQVIPWETLHALMITHVMYDWPGGYIFLSCTAAKLPAIRTYDPFPPKKLVVQWVRACLFQAWKPKVVGSTPSVVILCRTKGEGSSWKKSVVIHLDCQFSSCKQHQKRKIWEPNPRLSVCKLGIPDLIHWTNDFLGGNG